MNRFRPLLGLIAGVLVAAGGVVASPGCGPSIEDSQPQDAGEDQDAEAGPLLQCWCDGMGNHGLPMDQPGSPYAHYTKCKPGWICGQHPAGWWYCCPPLDEVPNCFDQNADLTQATPNGLACKPPPW